MAVRHRQIQNQAAGKMLHRRAQVPGGVVSAAVPVLSQLRGCLASGYPFVFGFTVYESFESPQVARTGHASLPGSGERAIGGHAVVGVGYQDGKQWFLIRNSWGNRWGLKGYFTLPYAYLTDENLASDFWTIRVVQ